MSKNIGFTKKEAEDLVCQFELQSGTSNVEAYAQKKENFRLSEGEAMEKEYTHEYIVVLRKRRDK